jgi:predicted AlkP superfamily phosphohydrolase/phosphomutase
MVRSLNDRMRSPMRVLLAAALAAAAAISLSCARHETKPVERKVVVLGIDGLEWDLMGPMIEAGELPNFARLVSEGSWGEIQSLKYLESPMIWTSIATGKLPEKHGITGFTTKTGTAHAGAILTSNFRTARTIWDVLGDTGRTVGVIMWLVTWPVEPVNGYLVSDYLKFDWSHSPTEHSPTTYPPELEAELMPLVVRTDDVPDSTAAAFLVNGIPTEQRLAPKVRLLKSCISVDETTLNVARRLRSEQPVSFFAIYLPGVDAVCHHFWVDAFPESGPPADPAESAAFGDVIRRYYHYADDVVGEFLDGADENTTVIVTSDHGHSGPKLKNGKYAWGIAMHDPTGVVIFWGKDIVPGRELPGVSVLDLTPTILALYGLPVGEDMDGKVLRDAISPDFLREHPVTTIPTYERPGEARGEQEPVESSVDDEIKDRLRSLGYID